ncbi:MAG TPA: TetR/AcrR family transcriptional regulator [Streptosporangiaceae bacterium]
MAQETSWMGDAAPEPPWRSDQRSAAKTPLTREAVVDAALRVMDAEGIDGLSMRRVGEELGTGAASIYWHVRNKGELLQLIFERVVEEIRLPEPDPARWQEQLREHALGIRKVLNSHRDVARLSLGRIPSGPALAVLAEWLFTLLRPVGIPDQVIAYLGDFMALYAGAYAFEESLGPSTLTGGNMSPEQFFSMLKGYLLSLPEERFPHTRSAVDALFSGGPDERYEFGIDLILRGLNSYATGQPSS